MAILFTQRFASTFWTFVLNRVRPGLRQGAKEHPSLFVVCGDALHQFDGALAQCFTPCREPDAEFRQLIGCQAIEKGAPIERRGLFHAIETRFATGPIAGGVIAHVSSRDHVPLSYWWTRVNAIDAVTLVPSERVRIERIREILQELDAGSKPS